MEITISLEEVICEISEKYWLYVGLITRSIREKMAMKKIYREDLYIDIFALIMYMGSSLTMSLVHTQDW